MNNTAALEPSDTTYFYSATLLLFSVQDNRFLYFPRVTILQPKGSEIPLLSGAPRVCQVAPPRKKGLCKKKRKLGFIVQINFYNHLTNFIEFVLRYIFIRATRLPPRLNPQCAIALSNSSTCFFITSTII